MRDGDYLVVGLRRSGLASCEAIHRLWPGARVRGFDSGTGLDTARLDAIGVEYVTGQDEVPVTGLTALIKSPGVPGEAPVVRAARAAGVPVWGEVELAHRMLSNPFVGVTGTNGKTTTTELIGAMLRAGGLPVEVAGNVGRALTELPGRIDPDAWVVAELSSFQLEDIDTFHAEVAVVLNITPDHIDRHGSLDAYLRAKLRLLENQRPEDVAVLNADDPHPARGRPSRARPPGVVLARPVRPDRLAACGHPWPAQPRERSRGRAGRRGDRRLPGRPRPRPARLHPRRRTGWRWWRPATASRSSTTPRRPTPRPR